MIIKIRKLSALTVILAAAILFQNCSTCSTKSTTLEQAKRLENYTYDLESPLSSRVKPIPPFLLNTWKKWDNRSDYASYMPTAAEMKIIKKALAQLPALNRSVMQKRMVGIYFIKNLMGSGLADWIISSDGTMYTYMVFNPSVLKKGFSELVTYKEKTAFSHDDPSMDINIDCGTSLSGFLYILIHETTHIVDYVTNVTPYTEEATRKYQKHVPPYTEFTRGIWSGYNDTAAQYSFSKRVTFYGWSGGPKLKISEAGLIYRDLAASPFASLYGSISWAEDLAEFITFYHITAKLNQPYRITLSLNGKKIYSLEPMALPNRNERMPSAEKFYRATKK